MSNNNNNNNNNNLHDDEAAEILAEALTGTASEDCDEAREDDLKAEFQDAVKHLVNGETRVGELIRQAAEELNEGDDIKELAETLIEWAVEAGAGEKYAKELVSRHLCANGARRRKKGAGRKAQFNEEDLKAIAAFAAERVGDKAKGALRAAMAFVPSK